MPRCSTARSAATSTSPRPKASGSTSRSAAWPGRTRNAATTRPRRHVWDELARTAQHRDEPDDRQWSLLARKRAEELKTKIAKRREFVERELKRIEEAKQAGKLDEAEERREHLLDHYGKYTDLADLLRPARRPVNDAELAPAQLPHRRRPTPYPLRPRLDRPRTAPANEVPSRSERRVGEVVPQSRRHVRSRRLSLLRSASFRETSRASRNWWSRL